MTPEDLGFDSGRLHRITDLTHKYVDDGKLPFTIVQVARRGETVFTDSYGQADISSGTPIREDSIVRIYSMTKPITSIALLQLYERGLVLLENPIHRYLPEFAATEVWVGGSEQRPETRPPMRPITVKDVLTHTAGMTYGFFYQHPVDALYRQAALGNFELPDFDLAEGMRRLAAQPLLFDPGAGWNYSMATDVCGALVEVISGQSLDAYFAEHLLEPLGMIDTGFQVRDGQAGRLTANYFRDPSGAMVEIDPASGSTFLQPPAFLSGGGGLVSTLADYRRFCDMLVNRGELDGERIIGSRTLAYMTRNHLPGGVALNDLGQSLFSEAAMEGTGFGLGFSVIVDPAALGALATLGEFAWGGAASTSFWIDPLEELCVVFLTQLMPSSSYPIRRQLRAVVNQALM